MRLANPIASALVAAVLCVALCGTARATVVEVASEDFESGASGWTNNVTADSGHPQFTKFLGRFGNTGGVQAVWKTYALPSSTVETTLSFDFLELDSWDGEPFRVYIDNVQVANDLFRHSVFDDPPSATPVFPATAAGMANYVFSGWSDQIVRYSFTVNTEGKSSIKLGFGATLNGTLSDESWGIDDVHITARIPEPATLSLLALGGLGLLARRRRGR